MMTATNAKSLGAIRGLLFLIMFVIGTDTFLISPLLPTLQSLFHVSTERSGWMMGAYTLGSAAFALVAGPLSDGWNRKKVMLAGLACFAVSTFLCGFAVDFWTMCLFRFLAGVSAAFTAPQVWASIPALFPAPRIAQATGVAYAGLAVSQAFGVPIGSALAAVHWSTPFMAIGACSLLLAIAIFFVVPDMKPNPAMRGAKSAIWKRYVTLLASGQAQGVYLAYFFVHLGSSAAFAFLGKWLADRFQLPLGQTGMVMLFLGLGNLVGSMGSSYILRLLNRYVVMAAGMVIVVALYAALPHLPSVPTAAGVTFAIFAVLGILFPLMIAMMNGLNATIRGTIASLATSTMNTATTLGAATAGWLYALLHGYAAVGAFAAVCIAGSLAAFLASGALGVNAQAANKPASN